jgi:hypothetical protein
LKEKSGFGFAENGVQRESTVEKLKGCAIAFSSGGLSPHILSSSLRAPFTVTITPDFFLVSTEQA